MNRSGGAADRNPQKYVYRRETLFPEGTEGIDTVSIELVEKRNVSGNLI
jgi:hypothetical protein